MIQPAASSAMPRLCVMMFLQYFIWGAWYVTAPNFLGSIGFGATDFGWTYSVGPIAGMITPFFVGMVADRFFPAQRVLAAMHILGAGIMFAATRLMQVEEPSPASINWVFFGYMLTFFPTLALTNALAMRNLKDSARQFPLVRVLGTIGWIAAGLILTQLDWDTSIRMFYLAAAAAAALGVFSLFLPHTPPEATGPVSLRELLGLDALALLKDRSYLVFLVASVLICIPLAFYYQIASRVVEMTGLPVGRTMSYGQMSEIFFMLVMPFFFVRLGVKWMLAIGMLAWVVRYLLFAFGAPDQVVWMILAGVILHGICYDFFFVTGQIYTDRAAPRKLRSQAQGLLVLFTLGLGMLIGAQTAGKVENRYTTDESREYGAQVAAVTVEIVELEGRPQRERTEEDSDRLAELREHRSELRHQQLATVDWRPLWLMPALFAAGVLLLFLVLFRPPRQYRTEPGEEESAAPPPPAPGDAPSPDQ